MKYEQIIEKFNLVPLPEEGGYYRETYRDSRRLDSLDRYCSTCIYYLITPEEFSGIHAVKSTEIFHFYAGDPVEMVQISEGGDLCKISMGNNIETDQIPQVVVTPNIWQGTRLAAGGSWALLGCTVAPGFEFEDFLIKSRSELIEQFPQHEELICQYTRI